MIPVVAELPEVAPFNVQVNIETEQLSLVLAFGTATAALQFPVPSEDVVTEIFDAAVTVGFTLSTTVTNWLQVEVFCAASLAVQITVVLPRGNDAGALLVMVTLFTAVQLSVAVAVPIDPT